MSGLRQVQGPCPSAVTIIGLVSEAGGPPSFPLCALVGTRGQGATVGGLVGATQAAAELGKETLQFPPCPPPKVGDSLNGSPGLPSSVRGRQIGELRPWN